MIQRFKNARQTYPHQFWLMFVGMMISTLGASMIWPFLMIFFSEKLSMPLTAVTGLMTLNAVMGLVFAFVAGPVTDRVGRKWVMVISQLGNGIAYLFMSHADNLVAFAVLMAVSGAVNPLYRVGADAMLADLIPSPQRPDAYALIRMSNNIGIALGPAIGGYIASQSYTTAFYFAAGGMITFSLLLALFAYETLPKTDTQAAPQKADRFGGYGQIVQDSHFVRFTMAFTLTQVCAAILWVLLAVYAKQNFAISERSYGLIPTTNALMVVFLQMAVTRITQRYAPLKVLSIGAFLYAFGLTSIAWGHSLWGFWISMVIYTVGELMNMPTSTTYVADLAPVEMRGRYMSIYGLTWGVAMGIGPLLGGLLNDHLGPTAIWYGAGIAGLLSTVSFLLMSRRYPEPAPKPV
jgi:MFS family permease